MQAKVVRFYGLSHKEVRAMPYKVLHKYWTAIAPIEAHEMQRDLQVVSFPNYKKTGQKRLEGKLKKDIREGVERPRGKLKGIDELIHNLKRG